MPIYKPYTRTLNTGAQERTRAKDFVRRVEPVYGCNENGKLLYIGWLAITDFSGQISDEKLQGIRLRKQNILVGDNSTFARFFPSVQSEGVRANKVVNADYATKNDLPSSYNRDERKLYQRIVEIIDMFFVSDPETAKKLRTEIVKELKVKKK